MHEKTKADMKPNKINNSMQSRKRLLILFFLFLLIAMGVAINTGYIQLIRSAELREDSYQYQNQNRTILAERGTIFDTNGNVMAVSISVDTVTCSPRIALQNKIPLKDISDALSDILGVSSSEILTKLESGTEYQLITSKIDREVGDLVREYIYENNVYGIYVQNDNKRYYPYGSLGAHCIGFTTEDNIGLYGLEDYLNDYLRGIDGKIISPLDVQGRELPFSLENRIDAVDGYNVVSSINTDIQRIAERVVKEAITKNDAQDGAVCIVANSKTGKILAMVSEPGFDLNDPRALPEYYHIDGWTGYRKEDVDVLNATVWRNKAIVDTYEPGSTFKSITTAMVLEENLIRLQDEVDDFPVTVLGATIHCWSKEYPHGKETFLQAIYNSCNPVFVKISHMLGVHTFYDYIEAFGFRDKTGIELIGEGESIFHAQPTVLDMSVASFGQRFQISPLQMVAAYNCIANGGYLIQPSLIEQIVDKKGNVIQDFTPNVVRQVISTKTSDTLREVLEGVVKEGGGINAYVDGYRVAGKTGTSETTIDDVYVSSFIGFAPADNPVITVLLIVNNPQGESYYGSQVAAPYAKIIFEESLEALGVKRDARAQVKKNTVFVPNLSGFGVEKAVEKLKENRLNYQIEGSLSGEFVTVMYQHPKSGDKLPEDGTVFLYTYMPEKENTVQIPYLIGKPKNEVIGALINLGLNVDYEGEGVCVRTSHAAGSMLEKGSLVNIVFRYTEFLD